MISVQFLSSVLVLFVYMTSVKAWENLTVIPFDKWNTKKVLNKVQMTSVPVHVMLSQTISNSCFDQNECKILLNSDGVSAIIPNFFVSGDGQIYVGHGWDSNGIPNLCSTDDDKLMIEISFIGDYESSEFPARQLRAAQKLLEQGLLTGKLSRTYDLFGEWQLITDDFPMREENKEVFKTWPHWTLDLSHCVSYDDDYSDMEYDYESNEIL